MSQYKYDPNQQPVSYPPPVTPYPPPAGVSADPPAPPGARPPPPPGYPMVGYPENPPPVVPIETKSRGEGFWKGCCAGLCCCCVLEECCI